MRFGKSDKIKFVSTIEGLESIEECLPRPAKYFIPEWFKNISPKEIGTVKDCPSFPDYFSQGYIIPMWADIKMNSDKEAWSWESTVKEANWDIHGPNQFLNHAKVKFNGSETQFVFKADSPWLIITPPGWSVLQLPLFYHFNQEWSVLPGVIDTDIHHEVNQQVLYHGNGKDVIIKSGDPFVLYIPFKRSDKLKHEVRYQTEKEKKNSKTHSLKIKRSAPPNGFYRKMQRERDRDI